MQKLSKFRLLWLHKQLPWNPVARNNHLLWIRNSGHSWMAYSITWLAMDTGHQLRPQLDLLAEIPTGGLRSFRTWYLGSQGEQSPEREPGRSQLTLHALAFVMGQHYFLLHSWRQSQSPICFQRRRKRLYLVMGEGPVSKQACRTQNAAVAVFRKIQSAEIYDLVRTTWKSKNH